MEAAMDTQTGTLDKFHLGVSADGRSCVMVFVDDDSRTINCVANFAEFNAFISSLNNAANEMARRRNALGDDEEAGTRFDTIHVASSAFQLNVDGGYIEGALVGDSGEVLGVRMSPEVACQMTRAVLNTTPAAGTS
jgi:hypothetical protein